MSGFELVKEVQHLSARELCPADKPVLMELAQCSKGNRTHCWPSQATLAESCYGKPGESQQRGVRRTLRHLEAHCWINSDVQRHERDPRRRGPNIYTLTVDVGTPCAAPNQTACLQSIEHLSMKEAQLKLKSASTGLQSPMNRPEPIAQKRRRRRKGSTGTDLPRSVSSNKQERPDSRVRLRQGKHEPEPEVDLEDLKQRAEQLLAAHATGR